MRGNAEVAAVFCVGLVVRLLCIWLWSDIAHSPVLREYVAIAQNLVSHHTFGFVAGVADSNRPPLFPAVIAVLWRGPEPPFIPLAYVQAVFGAVTCAFTFLIGRNQFGPRTGRIAGWLMVVAPMSCRYTVVAMSEPLVTMLTTIGVYFWGLRKPLAAGAFLALGALTHSVLTAMMGLLLLMTLFRPWRARRREYGLMLAGFLLTVSPWSIRNMLTLGHFTLIADSGWRSNLLVGSFDLPLFGGNVWTKITSHPDYQVPTDDAQLGEQIMLERAIRTIKADPAHWLLMRLKGYPRLFADSGEYFALGNSALNRVRQILFYLGNLGMLILAGWAVYRNRRLVTEAVHLWMIPLFILVAHLPLWVEPRRLLPAVPCLIVLAVRGAAATNRPHQKN